MTTHADTLPVPLPRRRGGAVLRAGMLFLICVVVADAFIGDTGFTRRVRARREYAAAQQTLRAVQSENPGLREEIRRLQTDAMTIEAIARNELGLIRPGEVLFVVNSSRP
jgi:cell division protein FtsB